MCEAGDKPLILMHLLQTLPEAKQQTIVFTASLESTHRLYRLLEAFGQLLSASAGAAGAAGAAGGSALAVAEYSSALAQDIRTKVIENFRAGRIRMSALPLPLPLPLPL